MQRLRFLLMVLGVIICGWPAAHAADQAGARRYNYVTHQLEFYDGSNWYNFGLGLSLGACTSEGAMEFNDLLSLYQYCNGTSWIRLVGIATLSFCSKKAEMNYTSNTYMYCNGVLWVNMKGALVI